MARPAKQRTPPPDRPLTVTLHEYLGRQNQLANQIRQYQGLATTLLSYVSQQVGMASQAIGTLQQATVTALEQNGVDPMDESLQAFADIAGLLRMDKAELGNPFAGGFGNALNHMDLSKIAKQAKKQKKPRKPKDPNAPQRPQTAFFLYQMSNREKFRNEMQAANPDTKPGDVQKKLTDTWNTMTVEQQKPYKEEYAVQNDRYNQAKAQYEKETGKDLKDETGGDENALPGATAEAADASGDAESSEEESSSASSSSSESPPPAPVQPQKSKKSKKKDTSKEASPEKKRKHKHTRDEESSDDDTPKKKKKSKGDESEKKKKKKSRESVIDPELTRQDKEQRKQKHSEYAPAQPNFGQGMGMAPMAGMGNPSMGSMLQREMHNMGSLPYGQQFPR